MKLLSKLLIVTTLFISNTSAGLVDGISVIINNEPITLYEIYKYSQKLKISKKEALDILIRQKLEDAQIKKLKIDATSFEVEKYIENIATKNGISVFEFFEVLKEKGIDEDEYKKDIKTKIKRDKLYRHILTSKSNNKINEKDLKKYYQKNLNNFIVAKEFKTVVYQSPNKDSLEKIKSNPMLKPADVTIEEKLFKSSNMDKNLESLLNNTKSGEFTPVFKLENKFTMFYLKEKIGIKEIPFERVKDYIYSLLKSQQDEKIINDYFEKLKSNVDIKVLRKP